MYYLPVNLASLFLINGDEFLPVINWNLTPQGNLNRVKKLISENKLEIAEKLLTIFTTTPNALPLSTESATITADDIVYSLTISHQEAQQGTWVKIITEPSKGKQETLKVKIPPQTKENSRLRLKNKGKHTNAGRGDLYLRVHLENSK